MYRKPIKVAKTGGFGLNDSEINFYYDGSGNRVIKEKATDTGIHQTYYVRDASGNVMSVYEKDIPNNEPEVIFQTEVPIYGSSRLGLDKLSPSEESPDLFVENIPILHKSRRGSKFFESSNHLGNVLTTYTDRRLGQVSSGSIVEFYEAEAVSATDYFPFGQEMPKRIIANADRYRFGFNGKEKDEEGEWGGLTHYDYGFRIYNPGIARFLSIDPLTGSYPWYTPYQFAGNRPIWAIDLDGLEEVEYSYSWESVDEGDTKLEPGIITFPTDTRLIIDANERNNNSPYKYFLAYLESDAVEERKLDWVEQWASDKANARNKNYVAKRFFSHWLKGMGNEYMMTKEEMKGVNIYPFFLKGTEFPKSSGGKNDVSWKKRTKNVKSEAYKKLRDKLSKMEVGQSAPYNTIISGGAKASGTLGQFSIEISGTLTRTSKNGYSFEGEFSFYDEYDFDVRVFNLKDLRSRSGESAVRKARLFQILTDKGRDFIINSEKIPYNDTGYFSD
ncbi:MAG: RHS repeat-associated core domain-containing protein [Lewinellaceae bacterium]|nr:RHS repeat-associated core domain-containing protein [Lewinellaceae bacterium]